MSFFIFIEVKGLFGIYQNYISNLLILIQIRPISELPLFKASDFELVLREPLAKKSVDIAIAKVSTISNKWSDLHFSTLFD